MVRQSRIYLPGGVFHVITRCARGRWLIEEADPERTRVLGALRVACARSDASLLGYAAMSNHLHLVLQQGQEPLGIWMRRLLGALTPQVNRALEEPGVVVSGRYKALLVQTEQYLARLLAYVHSNPVRAGVTRGPWISTWTSAHAFLAGADDLVRVSRVAQLLDCSPLELPRLLDEERPNCMQRDEDLSGRELRREDLAECTGGAAPARRCHLSSPILGNEEFVARIHQRLDPAAAPIRVGASWYLLHRNEGLPEDLRADLERIRADHGLASWNLGRRKPPAQLTRARRAALEYARGRCSVSLSRAAEAVGMSPGAASRLLWRKRKFGRVFQPVFAVAAGVLPERVPTPLQGACDPHHSEVDTKTQAADP